MSDGKCFPCQIPPVPSRHSRLPSDIASAWTLFLAGSGAVSCALLTCQESSAASSRDGGSCPKSCLPLNNGGLSAHRQTSSVESGRSCPKASSGTFHNDQ